MNSVTGDLSGRAIRAHLALTFCQSAYQDPVWQEVTGIYRPTKKWENDISESIPCFIPENAQSEAFFTQKIFSSYNQKEPEKMETFINPAHRIKNPG